MLLRFLTYRLNTVMMMWHFFDDGVTRNNNDHLRFVTNFKKCFRENIRYHQVKGYVQWMMSDTIHQSCAIHSEHSIPSLVFICINDGSLGNCR